MVTFTMLSPLLVACASENRALPHSLSARASTRVTTWGEGAETEEGRLSGSLNATIVITVVRNTKEAEFTVTTSKGSFEGNAHVASAGSGHRIVEIAEVTGGTETFKHVRSSVLHVVVTAAEGLGVDLTITGTLYY